jgi:hypothetical protein
MNWLAYFIQFWCYVIGILSNRLHIAAESLIIIIAFGFRKPVLDQESVRHEYSRVTALINWKKFKFHSFIGVSKLVKSAMFEMQGVEQPKREVTFTVI